MKKRLSLLAITLWICSCATPQNGFRLSPVAPEGVYEMGREYISLNNAGIQVELGFDGNFEGTLVFDLVVVNNTPHALSFTPQDFYYVLLDSADADSSGLPPRMAVHPDRIIQLYDRSMEKKENDKNINTLFGFIETGIGIINGASAFLSTENPVAIVDAVFHTVGTAGYYVSRDQWISRDLEQIDHEKEVVREEILRMGQVPPGMVASGFVFFPIQEESEYLMFCFPLEDQLFQFVYQQQSPG
jgi:hypothetical protein